MNVLFLTLVDFSSIEERNIYTDLLREFRKHEHRIYIISPVERKKGESTHLIKEKSSEILKLRIGNMQKINVIEKGISTISVESLFIAGIKKYFSKVKFDLVLYSTPPITFTGAVEYVKNRDGAKTYLLLKDIFPQNAVDIGMMKKKGVKGILYKYFREKEKKLYGISDRIGCMSQANVDYILEHNPEVTERDRECVKKTGEPIVEICPNSIELTDLSISDEERTAVRQKYNIPQDKVAFIYGGNLGKPQGIGFMLKCLHSQRKNEDIFFVIIGNGTEYGKVEQYIEKYKPGNIVLYQWLPRNEYDRVVMACDVGLIFLDCRFTIPNFPSRILDYMQAGIPVLACTDSRTDMGNVVVDQGFGWWCESSDIRYFDRAVREIMSADTICDLGKIAREFAFKEWNVEKQYRKIVGNSVGESGEVF